MTSLLAAAPAGLHQRLQQLIAAPAASAVVRENWKYTQVTRALELIAANSAPSDANVLEGINQTCVQIESGIRPDSGTAAVLIERALTCPASASALQFADTVDRIVITGSPDSPIRILRQNACRPLLIELSAGSSATVEDLSEGSATGWLQIHVGPGAHLDFSRLRSIRASSDWQQLSIRLERDATLRLQHYATGATLRRVDALIQLAGPGASAELSGCWTATAREKLDQQWHIEHLAPHTRSHQVHHGIGDEHATTTFRGRIYIDKACNGVAADLINRNLALAAGVTCNTKPELEIHNDDVRCSHGATVGQLPDESVFYLRSRGFDYASARALLAAGFIRSCIRGSLAEAATLALTGQPSDGTGNPAS